MQLNVELKSILTQFADYCYCIRKYLEKHEKIDDVCYYLTCLPCSKHEGDKVEMLLASKRDELLRSTTFIEVFIILENFTSFLNYHLFEKIIDQFMKGDRKSQKQLEYPSHLKQYLEKHKISEFEMLKPILAKLSNDSMELTFILNIKSTCRLSKITDLRAQVAHILVLDVATVQIYDIGEGSTVVTLLIPSSIGMYIFAKKLKFTSQQDNTLQALSVMKIECNGYTYYPGKSSL